MSYQCPLGRFLSDNIDKEEVKRRGYVEDGIFVMPITDSRLSWEEKKFIENIGDRIYGKRRSQ